ncbi:hypothetical protein [Thermaerobacter litoralis]
MMLPFGYQALRSGVEPAAGPAPAAVRGDAFARAVQQMLYRMERLDPARLAGDLAALELELETPEMPFVNVVAAHVPPGEPAGGVAAAAGDSQASSPGPAPGGDGPPAGEKVPSAKAQGAVAAGGVRAVLVVAFGPRYPETVGHLIATWTRDPGVQVQVVDEREGRTATGSMSPAAAGGPALAAASAVAGAQAAGPAGDQEGGPATAGAWGLGLSAVVKDAWLLPAGGVPRLLLITEHTPSGGPRELRLTLLERTGASWQPVWGLGGPAPGRSPARVAALGAGSSDGVSVRQVQVGAGGRRLDVTVSTRAVGTAPALVTPDGPVAALWVQRWSWDGQAYRLVSTQPVDQPLSVLDAFITLVSRGLLNDARRLVAGEDPQVVAAGRQLLAQQPLGQGWRVDAAGGSYERGPLVVTRGDATRVTVTFTEEPAQGGTPAVRIAAIAAGGR